MSLTVKEEKLLDHHWKDAESMWKDGSKGLDHLTLLVSTGAFAISITYVGNLQKTPEHLLLLILAWVALFVALLGQIFQYLEYTNWGECVKKAVNEVVEEIPKEWELGEVKEVKEINKKLDVFTKVTVLSLVTGLTFLLLFAIFNIL